MAEAIVTFARLNASVDRPVTVTTCPAENLLLAVYVIVVPFEDAAVTVAVSP